MTDVTPSEKASLIRTLSSCYTNTHDFRRHVLLATGDDIWEMYVSKDANLGRRRLISDVFDELLSENLHLIYLQVVIQEKPARHDVREEIFRLFGAENLPIISQDIEGGDALQSPSFEYVKNGEVRRSGPLASAPGYESLIRDGVDFLEVGAYTEGLLNVQKQVCRIEVDGVGRGTGFLIGPDIVITNYHVLAELIHSPILMNRASCRFDYSKLKNGEINDGVEFNLSFDSVIAKSEPSLPGLDYVILKLPRRYNQTVSRGWVDISAPPPIMRAGSAVFIMQHPRNEGGTDTLPMQLALNMESYIGVDQDLTRCRYKTNTLKGSSGAPCFDQNWNIVALHHLGDRGTTTHNPSYNQGIPIQTIYSDLCLKGHGLVLTEGSDNYAS